MIAKLHHGHLSHADGNGDWVLTIFSALSFVSYLLIFYFFILSCRIRKLYATVISFFFVVVILVHYFFDVVILISNE